MKNQYKINKLKRDLSYCKHGSLQYRLEYFFKAFKNAFHRLIYGYDDRDWYDYYYSFIERNMALFQELVNNVELTKTNEKYCCGCLPIIINGERIDDMTAKQTQEFYAELIKLLKDIDGFENSDFGAKNYIEKYKKAKESLDAYFDIMKEYFWELWN